MWSKDVIRSPSSLIWDTWNNDPTTLAILRAIDSCRARLGGNAFFDVDIVHTLAQKYVCFYCYSLNMKEAVY